VNFFLVTSPSFPAKNVREFIDQARKNPGKFNYASSGSGSPHHLFMEVLKKDQGLDIQHVPYKGSALAVFDIIGGKPEMMFLDFSVAVPNIKAGKITALGTSAGKQSVLMPEVPPISATLPGFDWQAWQGVVTTGGTPPAVVARLNAEMQKFQNTEEFRALLVKFGMEPWVPNTAAEFTEIASEGNFSSIEFRTEKEDEDGGDWTALAGRRNGPDSNGQSRCSQRSGCASAA